MSADEASADKASAVEECFPEVILDIFHGIRISLLSGILAKQLKT